MIIGTSNGFKEMIQDRIVADYSVDEVNNFLYIWDNTFIALESEGVNSLGFEESYNHFAVGNAGWSGLGYASAGVGKDLSMLDDTYYLHFAMKGNDIIKHNNHTIGVGSSQFVIGNSTTGPVMLGDYKRDGLWYNFDIPFSVIRSLAGDPFADEGGEEAFLGNVFSVLSGGDTGAELQFDNVFFYKNDSIDITLPDVDEGTELGRYGTLSLDEQGMSTFDFDDSSDSHWR